MRVMSDLHLEFNKDVDPGTGDVLVLAGDICVVREYTKYHEFFEKCAKGYNKVFYVMGNHEYYDGDWSSVEDRLRSNLPPGITLLQNQSEFYNGHHYVGATMWADFNNGDHVTMNTAQDSMSDYHVIRKKAHDLSPLDVLYEHQQTINWFEQVLPTLRGPVVMITHHQPSFKSVENTRYASGLQGAYCTDLTEFIMKHKNITHWCCGHVHATNDYMIGQCRVLSNPRGYYEYGLNHEFNLSHQVPLITNDNALVS